jgi:hypothetical protein
MARDKAKRASTIVRSPVRLQSGAPFATAGGGGSGWHAPTAAEVQSVGAYFPLTTGDVATPELIFALGEVILIWEDF